jgi:hypothetical protein
VAGDAYQYRQCMVNSYEFERDTVGHFGYGRARPNYLDIQGWDTVCDGSVGSEEYDPRDVWPGDGIPP